jgi:hypothetical protein
MKRVSLATATVEELVDRFAEVGIKQDQALLRDDIAEVNRLFDLLEDIEHALKRREGDQRRALIALYKHPNMQVRVKAAKATIAVAPHAARDALEAIRASNWQPQALEAGMSLRSLDRGIFKPT